MDQAHLGSSAAHHVQTNASHELPSVATMPAMGPVLTNTERRKSRKLVLCFDGTGNKFHGDDSDSNILKIFRMLDREADDQYHYYQPGIGTYVVSGSLSHTSIRARVNSWYQKAKDSAVGSSFDHHVVGGYRFLMRFYNPGDEIYMFGFSRGAYVARFLAEMLDYVGLLSHGNEEMVKFAWKAFSQWQCRPTVPGDDKEAEKIRKKKHEMYRFMKGFRETFSRPVGKIKFLGLFDTVNSVPRFEAAWMQRSKFPYTARSSAKVIRHAVSIDERRAKFRQDLMYQGNPDGEKKKRRYRKFNKVWDDIIDHTKGDDERGRRSSKGHLAPPDEEKHGNDQANDEKSPDYAPYRARSRSGQRSRNGDPDTFSVMSGLPPSVMESDSDDDDSQDMDEVWFSGGHADIGGGWDVVEGSKSASHVPLAWIVREAMRAGLPFDADKVHEMGCCVSREAGRRDLNTNMGGPPPAVPDIRIASGSEGPSSPLNMPPSPSTKGDHCDEHHAAFNSLMEKASVAKIHDSLEFGGGLGWTAVAAWKFMEYLPFRRMDLRSDGTWEPIRWPLPCGETRDIPDAVRVHGSVIRRMKEDENYRPGNLIVGGGGRGVRMAPAEYGIGEWVCVQGYGDPIGEIWTRRGNYKPSRCEDA